MRYILEDYPKRIQDLVFLRSAEQGNTNKQKVRRAFALFNAPDREQGAFSWCDTIEKWDFWYNVFAKDSGSMKDRVEYFDEHYNTINKITTHEL